MKAKKLLSLLLALLMVFSVLCLSACDDDKDDKDDKDDNDGGTTPVATLDNKTPYQAYTAALDKFATVPNYSTKLNAVVEMSASSEGITVNMTMTETDEVLHIGQNEYVKSSSEETMFGSTDTHSSERWYVDGVLYVKDSDGQTFRQNMTYEEYQTKYNGGGNDDGTNDSMKESYFEGTSFVKENANSYYVALNISDAELVNLFGDGESGDGGAMSFQSITKKDIRIYFDANANITKLVMIIEGTASGMTMKMNTTMTYDFNPTGTVTVPAGASSWDLVDY